MSNIDSRVNDLVINSLTKEQYDAALEAGTISDTELYMITDVEYPTTTDIANMIANYTPTENLANVALSGEYSDLLNVPTVDQTYNNSSTNAQSGTAVADAISEKSKVSMKNWNTSVTTDIDELIINNLTHDEYINLVNTGQIQSDELYMVTDEDYVQPSDLSNVAFSGEYSDLLNKPTIPVVEQSYNASSVNAQSGVAVANAISSTFVVMNASEYANITPISNVFYFIKE
jgi:hypothetical protein